jgi:hypothetical protein
MDELAAVDGETFLVNYFVRPSVNKREFDVSIYRPRHPIPFQQCKLHLQAGSVWQNGEPADVSDR